jgi:sec-independent protein translocase protein TatA
MNNFLLFGNLGMPEILIIALVVLLLFGGKKIPELMRGIGKGVKSFKDGVQGIESDLTSALDEDKKTPSTSIPERSAANAAETETK